MIKSCEQKYQIKCEMFRSNVLSLNEIKCD